MSKGKEFLILYGKVKSLEESTTAELLREKITAESYSDAWKISIEKAKTMKSNRYEYVSVLYVSRLFDMKGYDNE